MTQLTKFIIAVLIIVAGAMGYQAYTKGAFDNAQGVNVTQEVDVESH